MVSFISKMAGNFIVKPSAQHTATVIFLHGLGDTGEGWSVGFENIKEPHIKYIFPNAPVAPVTLNGGLKMPSWFDLYSLSPNGKEDEAGIKKAASELKDLIKEEEKKVPANRIVVGGFSQGGALALYTSLTCGKHIGGILALSTWLPMNKSFPQSAKLNSITPIFQCHGQADPVVPFQFGKMSADLIQSLPNTNFEFNSYPGLGHSSSLQEMKDIKVWLKKVLPSNN
ncbi:acyl-protein thioesterase 1-like [Xenia sp. Carnegie-2017]|uniref:acyl-protein thioesterase 1-like n=1 Tax=Xenia sp. Carnegie-2017 TaxID=2897299 RepID=UPI001F036360|nr:acyl-protein thioesterase 1-like [Xenia sp. Carnegie-2017]XP_046858393.1 acyl-protein thioesterase 1-like [Xenia sp. Carnegie-2017]